MRGEYRRPYRGPRTRASAIVRCQRLRATRTLNAPVNLNTSSICWTRSQGTTSSSSTLAEPMHHSVVSDLSVAIAISVVEAMTRCQHGLCAPFLYTLSLRTRQGVTVSSPRSLAQSLPRLCSSPPPPPSKSAVGMSPRSLLERYVL